MLSCDVTTKLVVILSLVTICCWLMHAIMTNNDDRDSRGELLIFEGSTCVNQMTSSDCLNAQPQVVVFSGQHEKSQISEKKLQH